MSKFLVVYEGKWIYPSLPNPSRATEKRTFDATPGVVNWPDSKTGPLLRFQQGGDIFYVPAERLLCAGTVHEVE